MAPCSLISQQDSDLEVEGGLAAHGASLDVRQRQLGVAELDELPGEVVLELPLSLIHI